MPEIRLATDADIPAVLDLWSDADAIPSATDDEAGLRGAVRLGTVLVAEGERRLVEEDHATSFWLAAGYEHDTRIRRYVKTRPDVLPDVYLLTTQLCPGPATLSDDGKPRTEERTMGDPRTTTRTRRELLGLLGGVGAAVVVAGCGGGSDTAGTAAKRSASTTTTTAATTATTAAAVGSCQEIPEETAGPYPGDGTNGPNVLTERGVVRSDIRGSIGSASGVAAGVPLTIDLTLVDANRCSALTGAAVYLWHCDRDGQYSLYTLPDENYLRGVQETGADGKVHFTSIFPAAYSGRWPHIHFEIFPSLATATNGANRRAVSQLALPADVCRAVYATDGYEQSVRNLAETSLDTDMVFSDGHSLQTPTVTGDVTNGYTAQLQVAV